MIGATCVEQSCPDGATAPVVVHGGPRQLPGQLVPPQQLRHHVRQQPLHRTPALPARQVMQSMCSSRSEHCLDVQQAGRGTPLRKMLPAEIARLDVAAGAFA